MSFVDLVTGRRPPGPLGTALLVAAPVVAAALFYVWTHNTTVALGYALSDAGKAHRALLEKNRALRIKAAALRSPDRLQHLAKSRFSLAPPKSEQVVRVAEAN